MSEPWQCLPHLPGPSFSTMVSDAGRTLPINCSANLRVLVHHELTLVHTAAANLNFKGPRWGVEKAPAGPWARWQPDVLVEPLPVAQSGLGAVSAVRPMLGRRVGQPVTARRCRFEIGSSSAS